MRVLVVHGGSSSEREASLAAGRYVGEGLVAAGHQVTYFDPGDDTTFMLLRNFVLDKDVVFPVLHGRGGEDGAIQTVLEALGVAFVGSGPATSASCFDKGLTLERVQAAGISFPRSEVVTYERLKRHRLTKKSFILKPKIEGARGDAVIVRNVSHFKPEKLERLFMRHGQMLIEELIEGAELTVPVVGDQIWPAVEVKLQPGASAPEFLCPPQEISPEVQTAARDMAGRVHALMGCRDMSETDMIWGEDGKLYFLEINTLPSFLPYGPLSMAITTSGMNIAAILDRLVEAAYGRRVVQ